MKKFFISIFFTMLLGTAFCGCQNNSSATVHPYSARTENIYATAVQYTNENDSNEAYIKIAKQSDALFLLLEQQMDGFVMDAYNYQAIDEEGTPLYTENELSLPAEIDAAGHHIRVSPNYFKFNPIETATGDTIENQMVREDNTLNILVPEKHKASEDRIIAEYLDNFYFEKIDVDNLHRKDMGQPLLENTINDLNINIIYVKDGQEYFTFRTDLAQNTNNIITDPIVSIYTGNIHVSYAHSFMTQFVYFRADAATPDAAYEAILPYVQQTNAGDSIQKVVSVEENFS